MRRLRERMPDRGDAGVTMSELIVTMGLLSLVLALVGSTFVSVTRTVAVGTSTRSAYGSASNDVDELGRVIRSASDNLIAGSSVPDPAVVVGTPRALTVISYVSYLSSTSTTTAPSQIAFTIDGSGNLVEQRTATSSTASPWVFQGATTTRTFTGPLDSTAALFVYYDANHAVITPGASGLTLAQRNAVASIGVTATVTNKGYAAADPVTVTTIADMPNLDLAGVNT